MELKVLWEFQSLNAWPCALKTRLSGSSPGWACAGEWKHSSLGRRALEGTTLLIFVAPRVISLANMAHLWFQSSHIRKQQKTTKKLLMRCIHHLSLCIINKWFSFTCHFFVGFQSNASGVSESPHLIRRAFHSAWVLCHGGWSRGRDGIRWAAGSQGKSSRRAVAHARRTLDQ